MNMVFATIGIFLLVILLISTAGCVNKILPKEGGVQEMSGALIGLNPLNTSAPSLNPSSHGSLPVATPVGVPAPILTVSVNEVSPEPYITTDPYRLPYRDHGNWSTGEPIRVPKIPQFTKSYVLRSNSTAVRVNVTQAPLVIDLTFNPQWENPDHSRISGSSSFVYSTALVTVHPEGSQAIVEQNGYGKEYSTDKEKKITLYRVGTYIITLSGDFINVNLAITTGSAEEKRSVSHSGSATLPPEEEWG
ncbi:MAG: hypothetical protein Q8R70_07440 [Methanoregula sp.]|nr:hypothetical protein [Methanoregula sp.]